MLVHQGLIFHMGRGRKPKGKHQKAKKFQQSSHAIYNVRILALIQTELKQHKVKFIIFKDESIFLSL